MGREEGDRIPNFKTNTTKSFISLFCMHNGRWGGTDAMAHGWKSEEKWPKLVLRFHHVNLRDGTQDLSLPSKCLYLMNRLA